MNPTLRFGAVGFGLIAVTYGFARFAFGLFLPQISADLALGPALAGLISGGAFLAYCVAILASAALTERIGPRAVAVTAALVAGIGMVGIAAAPGAIPLAGAVMLAGSSTGLASPPMAAAVARRVAPAGRDATNTWINAGTSAGVALSGPIALALGAEWRFAFLGFALAAFALALAAARVVPAGGGRMAETAGLTGILNGGIARLVAASFLTGAASTAIWSFGGELAAIRLGWGTEGTGALWVGIGAAGIAGAFAGRLVARFGIDPVHRAFLALMAAGILGVGAEFASPATAIAGGALFGAAYVMLTGIYLVWGVTALPDRPATGLTVAFLTLAIGQTVGAPLFGLILESLGPDTAVAAFAALGLGGALARADRSAPAVRRRSARFNPRATPCGNQSP
ncbi:MFS transporter [Acuticoccus kandeliae]|uniref:MFS transporter n=1 Tax=Acuticoccus kandeliae TaxID=2073160 RepID=UPI000D3E0310|nr:MFS transporter [Acuticoccus kandeliae]